MSSSIKSVAYYIRPLASEKSASWCACCDPSTSRRRGPASAARRRAWPTSSRAAATPAARLTSPMHSEDIKTGVFYATREVDGYGRVHLGSEDVSSLMSFGAGLPCRPSSSRDEALLSALLTALRPFVAAEAGAHANIRLELCRHACGPRRTRTRKTAPAR